MPIVSDNEIIEAIKKHQDENLTIRRLSEIIGYSIATTHERIVRLEKMGRIKRKKIITIEVIR